MTVRVLVADDQDLVRTGLSMILDVQPGIEVVGQAADGRVAVEMARRLRPDVCLVDIQMPGLDGIEVTGLLAGRGVPDPVAVVVITTFDLDEYVHGALRAGARGFLLKDAGPALLVQAVHAAAAGDALIAPNVTRRLLAALAGSGPPGGPAQPVEPLTGREEEVLALVARGRTNAEIAAELFIGLTTVKTHVAGLLAKIGARNRVEIAMWAYDTGRVGSGAAPVPLPGRSARPAARRGRRLR
ncbi:response regulator transcription factor [Streptomyces sp. NPDC048290]|uniref:response regulator transcription factor n=1 Tax=Streptomyces sp. NPDC048290 TaxID=3155811 RepID=UPI00341A2945